jgi:PTS system ascorbate-specific IIC component
MRYLGYFGVAIVVIILLALPQIEYMMDPEGYFLITEDYDAYVEHVAKRKK